MKEINIVKTIIRISEKNKNRAKLIMIDEKGIEYEFPHRDVNDELQYSEIIATTPSNY